MRTALAVIVCLAIFYGYIAAVILGGLWWMRRHDG